MDKDQLIEDIASEFSYFMPVWRKHIIKDQLNHDWLGKGINMQHVHVLIELKHQGPLPISHVGTFFCISKSDMTRITDKLQELDFIERVPSSEDRRVINIATTPQGLAFIDQARRNKFAKFKQILDECDENELVILRNFFKRFVDKETNRLKL